jgi:DNA/RNA endonuclease G (NUC1)
MEPHFPLDQNKITIPTQFWRIVEIQTNFLEYDRVEMEYTDEGQR